MPNEPDWNAVMGMLAAAIARQVAAELRTELLAAVLRPEVLAAVRLAVAESVPPPPKPKQPDRLVPAKEAAEYLGVAPGTLTQWRYKGFGGPPWVKVGRVVRYRMTDLEAWIERHAAGPGPSR